MSTNSRQFLETLLLGQEDARPINDLNKVIENQKDTIKSIWNNTNYRDFGLERLLRLGLALLYFATPGFWVRVLSQKLGIIGRKLSIEVYVLAKLFLPIVFFAFKLANNWLVAIISGVMILETLHYLATLIFISTEFVKPISYRRSLVLLFINYMEICLNYAVIYACCNVKILPFFKYPIHSAIEAIYFSFATSATVGYGDIVVVHPLGQILVITQIILFLVVVALFLNFFASKVQDLSYYNTNLKFKPGSKWQNSEPESK